MFISYLEHLELAYSKKDRSDWPGTYASVHLAASSKRKLYNYLKPYISNLKQPEKYHITTTFTKRVLDINSRIVSVQLNPAYFKYEKFGDNILVLRVYHPVLERLYLESRKAGATWDFPSYKPHITLSENFPSDIANLPLVPDFFLYTTNHVVEPLDD